MNSSKRLDFIDASRGIAMLLVCFAHFCNVYGMAAENYFRTFNPFTMIAAPTFMLVSGILLGFFYKSKKDRFIEITKQYILRGIIMLTLGRFLICLANMPRSNGFLASFNCVYITDTIAFCTIFGPLLVSKLEYRQRIVAGLSLQFLVWFILVSWISVSPFLDLLKEIFLGRLNSPNDHLVTYGYFPLFPWFGFYLIATAIGEKIDIGFKNANQRVYMFIIGISSIFAGLAIKSIFYYFKRTGYITASQNYIYNLTSPTQKVPPSMVYFLFYGGLGLIVIAIMWKINDFKILFWTISLLKMVGKNSLFAFILQFYIYFLTFYLLDLPYSILWPLFFLISIMCFMILIFIWQKYDGNRFLYMKFISKQV